MVFWRKKKRSAHETSSADPKSTSDETQAQTEPTSDASEWTFQSRRAHPFRRTHLPNSETKSGGLFQKIKSAFSKTHQWLKTDIRDLWKSEGRLVDDDFLRDLFCHSDQERHGYRVANQIRDRIGRDYRARKIEMSEVLDLIREEISDSLQKEKSPLTMSPQGTTVIWSSVSTDRVRRPPLPSWLTD